MSLRLIIEDDEGATTIVPLGKDAITIGRQQGNTIQLTEKNVSRKHARLFPDSDVWVIEDLNSYNGIKVNDKDVDGRTNLREGDIVQIGDYHLAITEDVDKSTLNYSRAGAANDGAAAVDPLMASSSADLPRLSADELHALQSGPQPITPAPQPALIDSGPVPATYATAPTYTDEPKRGTGLLVGFGLLVIIALGGAIFWLATTGDDAPKSVATSEGKAQDPKATTKQPPPMPPEPAVVDDGGVADPGFGDGGDDAADDAAIIDADDADDDGGDEPLGDDGVIVEPPPEPTPEPATPKPTNNKKKKKTPRNDTPKPTPTPTPTPPPEPSGPTADELLDEAKKLQFKSPGAAYKKAKESYSKKKTQTALSLMVRTACKMGEAGKAKSAYRKLSASLKADAEKVCAKSGITL